MVDGVNELEAALQTDWNPATLAAYGDALQAAGDLRGELIAIDLHADGHGMTPERPTPRGSPSWKATRRTSWSSGSTADARHHTSPWCAPVASSTLTSLA